METLHPHIQKLLKGIALEEQEEKKRYSLDQQHTLKQLKAEGLALHPLKVQRKNFGYADYPELQFFIPYPAETGMFRDGVAIECFIHNEEPVKGVLLDLDGRQGTIRLFAPDFPEWIEDDGMGIKLSPDMRTTGIMKEALKQLPQNETLFSLFKDVHDDKKDEDSAEFDEKSPVFFNTKLDPSQQRAVKAILANERICIIHGPPGTGKTTTLVEAIMQLVEKGEKVLVSAPANAAVDHIALGCAKAGARIVRVGNVSKIHADVYPYTPEAHGNIPAVAKEVKALKIRAEQFRKMALKYKRSFGKAEREQRNLLFKEVKEIRAQIKKIRAYHEEKLFSNADVVLGTPVGLLDAVKTNVHYDSLVMDEAGQCIEPLAWALMPAAGKYVLAGDPYQLPPTVLSDAAQKMGLNISILEQCFRNISNIHLLNTQYRMRESIAGFSSEYFYEGKLKSAKGLNDHSTHLFFYDTAGTGFEEQRGSGGVSLLNEGELQLAARLLELEELPAADTAFISPYAGQVVLAKEKLPAALRIATIDSFQGQEKKHVLISLVRSNGEQKIGFLKDYRRMNVAITRAKESLYIIGDSATLGKDLFYKKLMHYVEAHGGYRSAWELMD